MVHRCFCSVEKTTLVPLSHLSVRHLPGMGFIPNTTEKNKAYRDNQRLRVCARGLLGLTSDPLIDWRCQQENLAEGLMAYITLQASLVLPCDGHTVGQALFPDHGGASTEYLQHPQQDLQTYLPLPWARQLNGRPRAVCLISASSRAELPTGSLELGERKPRVEFPLGH